MKTLFSKGICVYIAPLKALARERLKEWNKTLGGPLLKWNVIELSGDTSYDNAALEKADILVCTPEKWDLISRGWRGFSTVAAEGNGRKDFVKRVKLLVLDEVHLLGEERGAVLEAIVSRTRFISRWIQENESETTIRSNKADSSEATRIVALSTALANPRDLADWIGIDTEHGTPNAFRGLYNFRPSVRPVPTKVRV